MSLFSGALGASRCGIFSRAEAIECGESDRSLKQARRDGAIVRLRRGMYWNPVLSPPTRHCAATRISRRRSRSFNIGSPTSRVRVTPVS